MLVLGYVVRIYGHQHNLTVIHYRSSYLGQHLLLVGLQNFCPNLKRMGEKRKMTKILDYF